ncbi:MAG TPA: hypothetical protein VK781_13540 [Solirubrobacteraceae bacterium]|nr:hypothetical protein [Solirubrobacteraceae bacterium]
MNRAVTLVIRAPLGRADVPGLLRRACTLLDGDGYEVLRCEVGGAAADAVTVDALARLTLAARRRGCSVQVCHASRELCQLVAFMGLAEVLAQ